jgi:hypothetical protein
MNGAENNISTQEEAVGGCKKHDRSSVIGTLQQKLLGWHNQNQFSRRKDIQNI